MELEDSLSMLFENLLRAPKRMNFLGGEIQQLKQRVDILEYDKSQMIDRIVQLEKQMKRKKNR